MGCTTREKSTRNKRRLRTNHPIVPVEGGDNLPDDRKNAVVLETAAKPMKVLDSASGEEKPKEKELGSEETEESDWGYCTEEQLEDVLLKSLEFVYNEALCQIASEGHSGEEALKAVLQSDHYYRSGDLLSDVVENAMAYLRNNKGNNSNGDDDAFRDLKQLQEDSLTRMVCSLQQLRPGLSKGEAMWSLLMSDLHVGRASTLEIPSVPPADEGTTIKSNGNGQSPSVISVPSPIRPSCSSSNFISGGAVSEPCRMCAARKRASGFNIAQVDMVVAGSSSPHNGFTFDVGTSQSASTAPITWNSEMSSAMKSLSRRNAGALSPARLLNDLKSKSNFCLQSDGATSEGLASIRGPGKVQTQSVDSSEKSQLLTQDVSSQAENAADSNSVAAAATELSLRIASPVDAGQNQYRGKPRNCPDIVGAILGRLEQMGITEKPDSLDQRNEICLKLKHQIKDLETQLKERIVWAQQKAMQAATKLSKDLTELNELRMERDETLRLKKDKQVLEELRMERDETLRLKKDKQVLEDTTMKRLAEMENALRKASGQVERTNTTVRKLETENAELRAEMEASKLSAAEVVAMCQEVEKREKRTVRRAQTWEKQESKLRDEINEVKQKSAQAEHELSIIKDMQKETEAKSKQEEEAKKIAIAQAEKEKRAKEEAEASAKGKEEEFHRKKELDFQRHKDDIERLEQELARLKATAESCHPNTIPDAPHAVDDASLKSLKETNKCLSLKLQELQESSRRERNHDRKCVMCMNEEVSVVFLPCAHQVVCIKCNDLGLMDCPFCRSSIHRSIHVFGVSN